MSETKYLPYLDGWRGLAITCLLVGHFFPVPGINFGSLGVNLFFVLSGLLMTRILFVNNVPLPTFYRRRISRILPSIIVFIGSITIIYTLTGQKINWLETIAAATFVNNYVQPLGPWSMPFGHIWSLSVEEHSYILLSLIAVVVRTGWMSARLGVGGCAVAVACVAVCYWTLFGDNMDTLRSEVAAFGIFASGSLLLLFRQRSETRINILVFPVLVALGAVAHWWSFPAVGKIIIGCGGFAVALNLLDRAPALVHTILQFSPLRTLGIWSFSIYLWQQPFYMLVHREGLNPFAGLVASLIVGVMAFYLIENPARLYLNRVWTWTPPALATPHPLPPK